jgi:hypothetical protein
MHFRATLELHGKTATGFAVPDEVVERLGAGRAPKVRVTVAGHTWRSSIAARGGGYLLGVSAENRAAAGVQAGDVVDVEVEVDDAPRDVEVPDDLAAALAAEPGLREAFDGLSFSLKRQHVEPIGTAKTPETRARRVDKALAMLRERAAR